MTNPADHGERAATPQRPRRAPPVGSAPPDAFLEAPRGRSDWRRLLRHLLPHYRRHTRGFAIGFVLLAATSLSAAAVPYTMKLATEALQAGAPTGTMGLYALAMIGFALLNALVRVGGRVHIFGIGRQVEHDLRQSYHAQLLRLDAAFFHGERTGDLVSRGTNDITAVRMFFGPGFLQICNTVMIYATILPIMATLDGRLTLLAIAPFPVALLTARLMTRRLYRLSRAVADQFGKLSSFVQESVSGMAVIRAHAQADNWRDRFGVQAQRLYANHLRHARLQSLFAPLMMFSGALGGWIILAMGGADVAAGRLTLGDFVAFMGYLVMLVWPTVGLGWILTVMQRGLAALERLGRILDLEPVVPLPPETGEAKGAKGDNGARGNNGADRAPPETDPPWRGDIRVRNLSFSYPKPPSRPESSPPDGKSPQEGSGTPPGSAPHDGANRLALRDIDLHAPAGSFIGLVGPVGSGKSTLLNCLARLYPIPPGTIAMDGRDLLEISEAELRRNLAMVPQESILFSAPMRDNLLFGAPEASDDQAWEAARLAAIDGEIRDFPEALDTLVGERGVTLSGGQRQRAALARALLLDPPLLLLDDVFSSVDARAEGIILDNIRQFSQGRTTVMVCSRVAALHQADEITVMDQGRIVDHGPHATLMTRCQLYRDLHNRMARHEALEALERRT